MRARAAGGATCKMAVGVERRAKGGGEGGGRDLTAPRDMCWFLGKKEMAAAAHHSLLPASRRPPPAPATRHPRARPARAAARACKRKTHRLPSVTRGRPPAVHRARMHCASRHTRLPPARSPPPSLSCFRLLAVRVCPHHIHHPLLAARLLLPTGCRSLLAASRWLSASRRTPAARRLLPEVRPLPLHCARGARAHCPLLPAGCRSPLAVCRPRFARFPYTALAAHAHTARRTLHANVTHGRIGSALTLDGLAGGGQRSAGAGLAQNVGSRLTGSGRPVFRDACGRRADAAGSGQRRRLAREVEGGER
ncbi:hypothetical protein GGX14DRAFT_677366 [Mycena pura]|uniref:Uncharacterized protein n=1 Tax=Mycena pura TaxID=153505 RepID=A0AAD6UW85_9AGAR|nr:hypothetical protein GGX14DRAFT_677366 [Mycena pura]